MRGVRGVTCHVWCVMCDVCVCVMCYVCVRDECDAYCMYSFGLGCAMRMCARANAYVCECLDMWMFA